MEELETSDAAAVALEAEKQQQNSSLSEESEIRNNEVQQQSSSQSKNSGRFSAFVTKYRVVQRLKKLSNGASIFQERPPGNEKNQFFYPVSSNRCFFQLLYYFRKVAEKNFKRNSDLKGSKKSSVA